MLLGHLCIQMENDVSERIFDERWIIKRDTEATPRERVILVTRRVFRARSGRRKRRIDLASKGISLHDLTFAVCVPPTADLHARAFDPDVQSVGGWHGLFRRNEEMGDEGTSVRVNWCWSNLSLIVLTNEHPRVGSSWQEYDVRSQCHLRRCREACSGICARR